MGETRLIKKKSKETLLKYGIIRDLSLNARLVENKFDLEDFFYFMIKKV